MYRIVDQMSDVVLSCPTDESDIVQCMSDCMSPNLVTVDNDLIAKMFRESHRVWRTVFGEIDLETTKVISVDENENGSRSSESELMNSVNNDHDEMINDKVECIGPRRKVECLDAVTTECRIESNDDSEVKSTRVPSELDLKRMLTISLLFRREYEIESNYCKSSGLNRNRIVNYLNNYWKIPECIDAKRKLLRFIGFCKSLKLLFDYVKIIVLNFCVAICRIIEWSYRCLNWMEIVVKRKRESNVLNVLYCINRQCEWKRSGYSCKLKWLLDLCLKDRNDQPKWIMNNHCFELYGYVHRKVVYGANEMSLAMIDVHWPDVKPGNRLMVKMPFSGGRIVTVQ
ncbi:hypothetical protein BLA29_003470 [Euroglyphus maynei]|uniref:Uncharacterized protein n=1 Tax=Euroglyphus maynei TaxID=6958 RepID=A0A1Y3B7Q4_EURMA|nr:hypothetical protein BLA29_003470 [Euroglyphus maynei]